MRVVRQQHELSLRVFFLNHIFQEEGNYRQIDQEGQDVAKGCNERATHSGRINFENALERIRHQHAQNSKRTLGNENPGTKKHTELWLVIDEIRQDADNN